MAKKHQDGDIQFHAISTGRSYVKSQEFFRSVKIRKQIEALLNSAIYKKLKEGSAAVSR